jgi:hypothetical protein
MHDNGDYQIGSAVRSTPFAATREERLQIRVQKLYE